MTVNPIYKATSSAPVLDAGIRTLKDAFEDIDHTTTMVGTLLTILGNREQVELFAIITANFRAMVETHGALIDRLNTGEIIDFASYLSVPDATQD